MQHLLDDKKFQNTLSIIAEKNELDLDKVLEKATKYMGELYTVHHPLINAFAVQLSEFILARGYETTIDVDPSEIKALAKLMRRHPVAFVMTHKTYIDMIVLAVVLARHGLPLPYIFSGINMSFIGLGEFGRKSGAIFIRRSFKDNEIYKATFRHYISSLVNDNSHFMWAIEGTRSRTGKILWPKMGILKYILEADQVSLSDVKYIPVSIVYDLIPDVEDMVKEGRGSNKSNESLAWFLNYVRNMNKDYGKISLRLGSPIKLDENIKSVIPTEDENDQSEAKSIPRFAFELVHSINQITPVTTSSLICTTLLSKFALNKRSLEQNVFELMELIEHRKSDALVDRGTPISASVQVGINLLTKARIIKQKGDGLLAKYSIVPENYLTAAYYSNMGVHHLYHLAFIELAIACIADVEPKNRLTIFWKEIMNLRDLFKFEFFYSNKSTFSDEIESNLDYLDPNWEAHFNDEDYPIEKILKNQNILVCQVVLSTYLEAYSVVAETLKNLDLDREYNETQLMNAALFHGEEMHWKGKIHRVESVSKPFLENGIRLSKNRDLIPSEENAKKKEIKQWLTQLTMLSQRIQKLHSSLIVEGKEPMGIIPIHRNIVPGSKTATLTENIMKGEAGAHIGAFFDLDRTLIKGFSAKEFMQARLLSGKMGPKEVAAQFAGVIVYALGNRNFGGLVSMGAKGIKGVEEKLFIEVGEDVYLKQLSKEIYPESRALVAAHLAKGHTVAIISAATPYQVTPIARDLGINHVLCTRLEVADGFLTGNMIEPACWGEGKAIAAIELTEKHDLDLSKSYFYTDSSEDVPLMELVGKPFATNPDPKLAALAYENNWPIFRFDDTQAPKITSLARTGLAFGSLIPAAFAGILSGSTSMSWRDGVNSMMATVGDLGCKIAGITLLTKGEEHLWSHRPAVFLFNHQSNMDFMILAKLLKRDVVAIGKKQLQYTPIGPLFAAAGMIFIDRKNKDKAIEAMKPAVDALKTGTSIVIAPEGTRSFDYKLGKFKKGAIHLAMQAKVPIVPIVIKNAHDVMPRGKGIINPSVVEVIVLPPIQTKKWKKKNINEYVDILRDSYLKELGQEVAVPKKESKKSIKLKSKVK